MVPLDRDPQSPRGDETQRLRFECPRQRTHRGWPRSRRTRGSTAALAAASSSSESRAAGASATTGGEDTKPATRASPRAGSSRGSATCRPASDEAPDRTRRSTSTTFIRTRVPRAPCARGHRSRPRPDGDRGRQKEARPPRAVQTTTVRAGSKRGFSKPPARIG
jgi:hypothetical protein